jgi:hypothetical protein
MLVKKFALTAAILLSRHLRLLAENFRRAIAMVVAIVLTMAPVAPSLYASPWPAKAPAGSGGQSAGGSSDGCILKSARGDIKHVIYIQFDNVHFRRDNPNVPSDLEQMPHLLNFLAENGTLLANHHTPLISHTADDIVTSLTGVYGDRHGQPVANSFDYFAPTNPRFTSSFEYWTDKINNAADSNYYMITPDGKNAPAPWVPWTRAGCNVGGVSTANIELENVNGDLKTAFASDPTVLNAALAEEATNFDGVVADFEGVSIHCAAGNALCSSANHGEPDALPDEPGGYTGFNALYGHKFVAPVINPGGPLVDLDGNFVTDSDTPPHTGFPGFGGITAAESLAYVAAMQEHGVPVTYAYISDAHDNHPAQGDTLYGPSSCLADPEQGGLGPGDECYVDQLAFYDRAFGKFFDRLAADGINKSNTLFVITADENDHFAGGAPFNQGCDGVKIACVYTQGSQSVIGEIDANMDGLLATEPTPGVTAPFDITFDMAPSFYVNGNPPVGDPLARQFERAAGGLTAVNPRTGATDKLMTAMADPVELKLLHMLTGDPLRNPTFTMFGDPDYFFVTGPQDCSSPCLVQDPGFAWNHGGIQPEIVHTWLGIVGPGVQNKGVDDSVWSDHTDIRPTMLVLAGLKDDYQHEGRALVEDIEPWALPHSLTADGNPFTELAEAFKQINAPNAALGRASLRISTKALTGSDSTYSDLESKIAGITSTRDLLAGEMLERLEDAEFNNTKVSATDVKTLVNEANQLLNYVSELDGN